MSLYRYLATIPDHLRGEIMNDTRKSRQMVPSIAFVFMIWGPTAAADVVTDWNVTAADITVAMLTASSSGGIAAPSTSELIAVASMSAMNAGSSSSRSVHILHDLFAGGG
jgi:hypothetical protein